MDPILTTNVLNVVYEVSTLAVVVLGLAVVFGLLGVMNLAHGEFVMIGAYCAFFVQAHNLPFLAAVPLALLVCGFLGLVVERVLVRPLYARPFDTLLATWGLGMLLREAVEAVYGRGFRSVATPLTGSVEVLGADYPAYRLLLTLVSVALVAGLVWWFVRSATGRRIRAVVDNPEPRRVGRHSGDRAGPQHLRLRLRTGGAVRRHAGAAAAASIRRWGSISSSNPSSSWWSAGSAAWSG